MRRSFTLFRYALCNVLAVSLAMPCGAQSTDVPDASTMRSLMPMMQVAVYRPHSSDGMTDVYTRLLLRYRSPDETGTNSAPCKLEPGVAPPPDLRRYDAQSRRLILRWLAAKTIARVMAIKATVSQPKVATTTELTSVSYESGRDVGESWNTELNSDRVITPYFRVDPSTLVNLEMSLSLNSSYDVNATRSLIDVLKRAVKLIQPTSALVTSLNEDRFQAASQFTDETLSSLLKRSVVERSSNDFALPLWTADVTKDIARDGDTPFPNERVLAAIHLCMPIANRITPAVGTGNDKQPLEIGTWEIVVDRPIVSIFSSAVVRQADAAGSLLKFCHGRSVGCVAFAGLDPATVLNYPVDENVTVMQALAGDQGVVAARDKLIKSTATSAGSSPEGTGPDADGAALCTLVAGKAQSLGFDRLDVAAIVWAYASQSFVTPPISHALHSRTNCPMLSAAYDAGLPGEYPPPKKAVGHTS